MHILNRILRFSWFFILLLIAAGAIFIIFRLGQSGNNRQQDDVAIVATADLRTAEPLAPFAALDPAIVAALQNRREFFVLPDDLRFTPDDISPLGSYLPRRDDDGIQYELRPEPALAPLDDNRANTLLDADGEPIASDSVGVVDVLEFAEEGCAPSGLPASGVLTQRYHRFHTGIDLGVPLGTPVQATHSGEVTFAGWSSYGYGYVVILENGRFITYYAHLTNFNVQTGDEIGAGSVIGWSGSTGNSTGPHIHYETRLDDVPIDPLTFESRGYGTC